MTLKNLCSGFIEITIIADINVVIIIFFLLALTQCVMFDRWRLEWDRVRGSMTECSLCAR